ncbi:MAG: hypothetical protein ACJAZO_003192 [Myxococcota bacterium]|jgi:hypothetical protein
MPSGAARRAQSRQALDAGYARLTSYPLGSGGCETSGTGPGNDALSAFEWLPLADMKEVDASDLEKKSEYLLA